MRCGSNVFLGESSGSHSGGSTNDTTVVLFSGLNVDDDHVTRKQLANKALTHLHIADE